MSTTPPEYSAPPAAVWPQSGPPAKRPVITWDVILTIILLVLLGILAFIVSIFGLFLVMASDPCGGSIVCDTGLIEIGVLVAVCVPWVVLVAAVVVSIVLMVKRRMAFWVPLLASPLVIGALFAGAALASAGVPTS